MMKRKFQTLAIVCLFIQPTAWSQKTLLNAGPLVGYSEMREVQLWVQTTGPADVLIQYWNVLDPEDKLTTESFRTGETDAFTAKFKIAPLDPGQRYEYRLYIDDIRIDIPYRTEFQTLPIWRWRGAPPPFRFAAGSCAYINETEYDRPGTPYGGDYEIFESIYDKDPDFMIWLGDNIYYREPDWNSRTGILHRYTHDRAIEEIQPMLGSMHHYAIWDDHDYGPNNSDRGYWLKDASLEAFKMFWPNPSFGTDDMPGAISYFNWNDADFFLLDNRYYRSPDDLRGDNKTILGEKQKQWLKDNLVSSQAIFKFVVMGGQFLNDFPLHETYSNNGFNEERKELIDFIHDQDIDGVIFLTGDRHFTELSMLESGNEPVIYDLTISPLTSSTYSNAGEENQNSLRVEGTLFTEKNFGILDISGPLDERNLEITIYDSYGVKVWSYVISQQEWMNK